MEGRVHGTDEVCEGLPAVLKASEGTTAEGWAAEDEEGDGEGRRAHPRRRQRHHKH